ncbi:MAG TPA: hypothetical protein VEL73_09255 [Mycobacteriales bacterium]|nr:hypothetical protein [Mycobacteriales bacterium]
MPSDNARPLAVETPDRPDRAGTLAAQAPGWPKQSRVATTALLIGVLAIPCGLLVYPGLLLGLVAVGCGAFGLLVTRGERALGRGRAGVGLVAGLVALVIAVSLGMQGLRTIRDCQDRVGHRPNHDEIQQCVRDGL